MKTVTTKTVTRQRNSPAQLSIAARQKVKERKYWINMLSTDQVKSHFPYDHNCKTTIPIKSSFAHETFQLSRDLSLKIVRLSGQSDLRLNMILNAGVVLLLYKYGNHGDIIVGAPIYKQEHEGDFLNTVLPLKNHLKQDMTFKEILLQVKQTIIQATRHQEYPIEVLVHQLKLPLTGKGFPLFDVVILLENIHDREYIQHIDTNVKFIFSRNDQTIYSKIEYNESLYSGRTIQRLINHFKQLMKNVLLQIETKISGIDILLQEEKQQLLNEFNQTSTDYPGNKTIVRLVEEQAGQTPDNIAAAGPLPIKNRTYMTYTAHISYRELNEKSNRLAHLLIKKGIRPDTLVALMMEPSVEMIIAISGILKAGAAYLPIDPAAPINRVLPVLEDSQASLVITGKESIKKFSFISLQGLRENPVEPVVTSPRPQVKNLDTLQMPDRSLVDYEKYHPFIGQAMMKNDITLQFSRGCAYNCAYCFKIWPKNYVIRSPENMFEEIRFYYNMGVRRFAFVDDLPNIDVKISTKLYQLIIKNKLNLHLHYVNGIRGDILTKEYIDLMVEAGTVVMDLALETTSPRLQKLIRKNLNLERLHQNLCYILGKYPHVILETAILHGIPTETPEEAMESLEYIKQLQWIHFPYIHLLKIYPNTDMARIAVEHGVSKEALQKSADLAYHEIPETLPFSKEFTRKYQSQFLSDYFLSKERLLSVLPAQMKVFTEDELVQAYDGYLPTQINSLTQLLDYIGIFRDELKGEFLPHDFGEVPGFNRELKANFPVQQHDETALRILLLDLSQYFTGALEGKMIYDVVEPPLGLMYLLTHLNRTFGKGIKGKIAKSRVDFDSFRELKKLVESFKPDVIGVRTLNFYRDFFHETISLLRQWGVTVPIIAGGPYATSSFPTLLTDRHIDLAVLGEGEITLAEIIEKILDNDKKLPGQRVLKTIPGIALMENQTQRMSKNSRREVLVLDRLPAALSQQPAVNTRVGNKPGDLSYIIYTSGSTGIPKGVMIRHSNLVNQISGLVKTFGFDSSLNYILLASFTFDVSVMHIFLPLTTGAKLFLMSNEVKKDPNKLWRFMARNKINVLNIVPAFMKAILENTAKQDFHFKYLFVGGDVFPPDLYRDLKKAFDVEKIINIYGPTETTINAVMFECGTGSEITMETIPIGKPLKNYRVYILDGDLNPVPPGVGGELCIAGKGLARGYLNRPELTAEKFIEHRSHRSYRSYIYRTGDLARWLPDGNIEFLGRIDRQVKIRGFRIEPGEIENHLLKHEAVKDVVVITREEQPGNKNLYAYYVAKAEKQPELWPSIGEYFIWDDLMYYAMTHDERRNKSFKAAINRLVKNKTVVEVGTGQDAVLARFCIEAGAKKVYAVEILEEYFQKAKQTIEKSGLAGKLILIHGDIRNVELPEEVDICLANQCGTIGSSEGAINLHNHARKFLKAHGTVIPHRCLTKIAAVSLPDNLHRNPGFTELPGSYVEKIFKKFANHFDLRLCIKNFPKNNIISDVGTFEELAFREIIEDEAISRIHLAIDKDARLDGFLLWLNLYTAADELIDTLAEEYVWLPVFIPVFYPGIKVLKGDRIEAECLRYPGDNDFSPDYKIKGMVLLKNKEENFKFQYESSRFKKTETQNTRNPFYRKIIHKNSLAMEKQRSQRLEAAELREYLAGNLPGHMIPSYFVQLQKIPLTSGGKVNKQALPEYEIKSSTEYAPPGNEIEKQLVKMWAGVLLGRAPSPAGQRLIGIHDNFFHLGGHSLKATILISRIHKKLEVRIPLLELFKTPTIRGISQYINRTAPDKYTSIQAVEKKDYYAASSPQKRLYILQQMEPASTAYNMPETIPLPLEPGLKKLENTFKRLINRHESLRTSFHVVDRQSVQRVHDEVELGIEYYDLKEVEVKVEVEEEKEPFGQINAFGENLATEGTENTEKKERSNKAKYPDPKSQELRAKSFISSLIRPFDLSQAPLLRVLLLKAVNGQHLLIVDMHHIISDGVSRETMAKDFMTLYPGESLPPLEIQYKDFSEWQNTGHEKETGKIKKQEAYWLKQFQDEIPVLNMPIDYARSELQIFAGNTINFTLGRRETGLLKKYAAQQGTTSFMVLLTIFYILLSKLSGQEDIVIGTPMVGRRRAELEKIVGMFVNTLPLRNYPGGKKTFKEFLTDVEKHTLEAFENQDYPFEALVEKLNVNRDLTRNPLFDVMFAMQTPIEPSAPATGQNKEMEKEMETAALETGEYSYNQAAKFDLTLSCMEAGQEFFFFLEYCTELFKKETIRGFTRYFKKILSRVIETPGKKISEIEIITGEQKKQLLVDYNDTEAAYPRNKTIHGLFVEQAERTPDNIALIGPLQIKNRTYMTYTTYITYRELHEKSNRLAYLLQQKGIQPDTIVGIMVERSLEMIIGILGILKAGSAYLPIDPKYPQERINYMLADSGSNILLTTPNLSEKFEKLLIVNCQLLMVNEKPSYRRKLNNPPKEANSIYNYQLTINNLQLEQTDLVYIIYTSGSTGKPKGVIVENSSVVNILWALHNQYPFTGSDVYLLKTSYIFDVSVTELFGWFLGGGRLAVLENGAEKEPLKITTAIKKHKVSHINFVPSMFSVFVDSLGTRNSGYLSSLKYIFLAGEALLPAVVTRFAKLGCNIILENIYGPTESTIYAGKYSLSHWQGEASIPIGKPLPNIRLYILDKNNLLQPPAVPGELCITGTGLARGYLNQPGLTAEKFIFATKTQRHKAVYFPLCLGALVAKIYKTGDLARWRHDGNIEFLGRIDFQVKIRGFRVELGEIENRLLNHPGIKEAVVLTKDDHIGNKYLCAYIVPGIELSTPGLRKYLAKDLPGYMIPSYFVQLEEIPLTPNGKIDRNALPAHQITPGPAYVPPRTVVEMKLTRIWLDLLGAGLGHSPASPSKISIDDNFFELGGHSLNATIMMTKIHKQLNAKVPLLEIFKNPTIRGLSQIIAGAAENIYTSIKPAEKKEYYPLSSAQKRLYFIWQMDVNSTSYNMPLVLPLGKDIGKEKLQSTLKRLVARHESLRTSFTKIKDIPVQRVHDKVEFETEYYDMKKVEEERSPAFEGTGSHHSSFSIHHSFIRPFDLTRAPLMRSGIIKRLDGSITWIVDIHHIVSDGTSHTILTDDFISLYNNKESEPLKLHYKDFSQWQNHLFASGVIKAQEDYWRELYHDAKEIPRLNLPVDYKRPEVFTFTGDNYTFMLEKQDAVKFRELGSKNSSTLYINILTALNTLFYKYTGQTDIIIGSGIAGRLHVDLLRIIGMFVNTLAMRNHPKGQKTYRAFLEEVIDRSIKAFDRQDVQFEELVDKIDLERDASRNPLFDVMMVVQNFNPIKKNVSTLKPNQQKNRTLNSHEKPAYNNRIARFDMTFFVYEEDDRVIIDIEFYTAIFKKETIIRLTRHFRELIKQVIANPGIKLEDIDFVTQQEKQKILYQFNDTETDYPKENTIPELFEKQVENTPGYTVVIFGEEHLTYKALDRRSSQVARYLYDNGTLPDQPVGILMDRCTAMLITIMGILKAGGAYVPLSTSFPEQRIKHMIDDAHIKIIIGQKQYIKILNRLQWECMKSDTFLCIDSKNVHEEDEPEESKLMSRKLWEYVGETAVDEITGGGWNSSYTGQPIPKKEMDQYGDNILQKLTPFLHPQMRVLEIGCASGISMYRIAPKIGLYYGTDLSRVIIEKNKERVKKQGHKNIKLSHLAAHEIHRLDETGFDLIIINSVIQCFTGHNYLGKVLRKAIHLMGSKGYLFIGDIMDQELKTHLIADLVKFKQNNTNQNYKTKTDWSEELFISRAFLEDLAWDYPAIQDIKFSNKIYTIENELTKFRYDALIYIDKTGRKTPSPKRKKTPGHKHQHDLNILEKYGKGKVTVGVKPHNMAYIIYTSGSTGIPKGVMAEHKNVVRLVKNTNYIEFKKGDKILQTGALEFDASTFEIWGVLLNGLTLVLEKKTNLLAPGILKETINKNKITTMWMTSSYFNRMSDADMEIFHGLKHLLVGGELLSPPHINRLRNRFPQLRIINGYGPTENVTFSTTYLIDKEYEKNIPIGKPIANSTAYIVDKHNHLQPVRIPGELFVGGDGVARGYLNDPELTSEKFISLFNRSYRSYRSHTTYKSYITGDLARWLQDGNIEFLGRIDQQVKLRGFRIELEEIENQLLQHDLIKEAVVLDRLDSTGSKYLCAYIVSNEKIDLPGAKKLLAKYLPDYMIPSFILQVENIPLTPNGKVDRRALPKPGTVPDENYTVPGDEIEKKLVETWAEVLGIEKEMIGIGANFFELGGHSLKATILTSKIHKEMKVKVPLVEIFNRQTIKELSQYIKHSPTYRYSSVKPNEKKEYYALSAAQKRLYILQQMELDNTHYNMTYTIPLAQEIHKERLEKVFKQLTRRHESFRTSFHMIDGQPVQRIHDEVEFKIEYYDLKNPKSEIRNSKQIQNSNVQNSKQKAAPSHHSLFSIHHSFIVRPFDLTGAPLLRVGIIELLHTPAALRGHPSQEGKEGKYLLKIDMHHIISDGTSQDILEREFAALYEGKKLSPLRLQYKDYSQWQNSKEQQEIMEIQEKHWLKELSGELPILHLVTDYPRPLVQSFEGRQLNFFIDKETTSALKTLSQKTGATLYMILLSVLNVLLAKLSGQEDIIIGTPIAARRHADLENIVGMFVNTISMRNYPERDKDFLSFIKEVKERTLKAYENQEYPFEDLVDKVPVNRDTGRNPLFDVMFNFLNIADLPQDINIQEIDSNAIEDKGNCKAKFDITFQGEEINKLIYFAVDFCTTLYKTETIKRFIIYFKKITLSVVENPGQKISSLDIISPEEKKRILNDLNNTSVEYPKDKTIHQLFAEQVNNTPDLIAVIGPLQIKNRTYMTYTTYITYRELNEKSHQLAHMLIEKGVGPDTIVGIMVQPSIEMIIGILGILKAGGAYLPIDREYPGKRIDYMLKDSSAKMLVSIPGLSEKFEKLLPVNCQLLMVNDKPFHSRRLKNPPKETNSINNYQLTIHNSQLEPTSLAYIIYTSGSTGMPKGVIVEHKSLVNLCLWHNTFFSVTSFDRTIKYAGFGFDASVWEIFPYLIKGAAIYVVEEEIKVDIIQLNAYFEKNHITIGFLPTQMCEQFMDVDNQSLRILLTGGDKLKKYIKRNYQLVNNYGPTENTVVATSFIVNGDFMDIPIGKPMDNVRVYILDEESHLQPIGVPGQLCISGESLARGYLNNPDLTNSKLQITNYKSQITNKAVPFGRDENAFGEEEAHELHELTRINEKLLRGVQGGGFLEKSPPGRRRQKIYKTGDLARWLPDGNIEFSGRIDHQVKIRGFRIEPAEIETQLLRHDMVKEAVILASQDETGDKYLAAYIVPSPLTPGSALPGSTPSAPGNPVPFQVSELRKFLSRELPNYMIPAIFIEIEKIPLNASGKIDRKKLPAPKIRIHEEEYTAPRGESELYLAHIWSEVLGIQKDLIGIDANFFELGGHSLKALQVVSKLSREFDITLEQMFLYPTIAGLASQLVKRKNNLLKKIRQLKQNLASANDENSNELQLLEKAHTRYKSSVIKEELPGLGEERNYRRILVTGVPGYLGMHLVFELLSQTNAHLYLLIRGRSVREAEKRLSKKSRYYFAADFYESNQHRLTVLAGDLRDKHLGLPRQQYEELSRTVEAVVHSAANVRHFGRYEDFYEDNVKATENLLEFTLAGQQKDFHHISTLSVGSGTIKGKKTMLFTEYCHDVGQEPDNVYIKTKLEAEKKVLAYSKKGLNASIYRVGNLVAHSETRKFQENIDDNAFYAGIKTYISLGMLPHEEEIWADLTFIDQAAEALVVLITKASLCNETFHLHNTCKLSTNTLAKHLRKQGIIIKIVSMEQFLDYLADHIDDRDKRMIIDRFLLHWGILGNEKQETINMIVSDRTQWILRRLNFEWKEVTMEYMEKMINNCRERGFI